MKENTSLKYTKVDLKVQEKTFVRISRGEGEEVVPPDPPSPLGAALPNVALKAPKIFESNKFTIHENYVLINPSIFIVRL